MTAHELPKLDLQLENDVNSLCESILSKGISPIFRHCFEDDDKKMYIDLIPHLDKIDIPNFKSHPAYSNDELKLIYYLENAARALHLKLLLDKDFFFKKVAEKNANAENLLSKNKESWGLIETSNLKTGRQWYEFKNYEIHIHQPLIGCTNSHLWLAEFICEKSEKNIFIRPDPLRIKNIGSSHELMERAAAYGRPFNVKWLKDLRKVEVAEHVPDADVALNQGYRTQFIWEPLDGGKLQFAIEELPDNRKFSGKVCTRFIHGIFDKSSEIFEHFDGAIHIYDSIDFENRETKTLKDHFNEYDKAKIFLVDTGLSIEQSEKLVTAFYRWNPLATEYFTKG